MRRGRVCQARRGGGAAAQPAPPRAVQRALWGQRAVSGERGGESTRGEDDTGAHARHMRRRTPSRQLTLPPRPISRVSSASLPSLAASYTALPIESLIAYLVCGLVCAAAFSAAALSAAALSAAALSAATFAAAALSAATLSAATFAAPVLSHLFRSARGTHAVGAVQWRPARHVIACNHEAQGLAKGGREDGKAVRGSGGSSALSEDDGVGRRRGATECS
jgi:hypothetical protein